MFESKKYEELIKPDNGWKTTDLLCLSYSANPRYVEEVVRGTGMNKAYHDDLETICKHALFVLQQDRAVGAWEDRYDNLIAQHLLCNGHIVAFLHEDGEASFHPKLILQVLRKENEQKLRMIVSSRNLTGENLLEGAICLEGAPDGGHAGKNGQLIALFNKIKENEQTAELLDRMIGLCEQTEFCVGDGSTAEVLVGGIEKSLLLDRFEKDLQAADDCVIISPFLSASFLKKHLNNRKIQPLVVGNRSDYTADFKAEMDKLPFYVLKEENSSDGNSEEDSDNETENVSGLTLHAKIYAMDKGDSSVLYIGSANFSHNGFCRNCEIVVRVKTEKLRYADELRTALRDRIEPCGEEWTREPDTEYESRCLPEVVDADVDKIKAAIVQRFAEQRKKEQLVDLFYELFGKTISEEEPINDAIKKLLDADREDLAIYAERICEIAPEELVKNLHQELKEALKQV